MSAESPDDSTGGFPTPDSDAAPQASVPARARDGGPYNPLPDDELDDGPLARLQQNVATTRYQHAALARQISHDMVPQLAELRKNTNDEIARLGQSIATLKQDTTTALTESLRPINNAIEQHEALLRRILARQERNQNPPVDWAALNAQQAQTEWARLADWIEHRLVPWHEITREQLPDCWALHRFVVVELSALRTACVQAYLPHTDPAIAVDWLHRWLPTGLTNIKAAVSTKWCRPGEHMISGEESNARRRAAATAREPLAAPAPPTPSPAAGKQLGRAQLAAREFWQPFYQQARDADLAWRSERERATNQ